MGSGWSSRSQSGHHVPDAAACRLDTKKKTLTASERDEAARTAFRQTITTLAVDDLVVVDEMGSSIALTRLYYYSDSYSIDLVPSARTERPRWSRSTWSGRGGGRVDQARQ
jgi:hypothetical protein